MSDSKMWQTRNVFISSTFKDMGAERDYLNNFVFPELEERLRKRWYFLEPIDLRWGVETASLDEEYKKEILILKVCLGEIERSHPFLIALMGDRYGWIPPHDRMQQATQEAGYEFPIENKSITALEIEYGVLNNADQNKRSFFYMRDPLPYDKMPKEIAAIYSDTHAGNPEAAKRLKELKESIRQHPDLKDRIRTYTADWDADNQKVTKLDAFGKMVLEDLWSDLAEDTSDFLNLSDLGWEEQEKWILEEFIESKSRTFWGRGKLISSIIDFALNQEPDNKTNIMCLPGQAGSGKSAIFSHLYRQLEIKDIVLLANSGSVGTRSGNINDVIMRWVFELEKKLEIQNLLPENPSTKDLDEVFYKLLEDVCKNHRVIILMDALDQMGNDSRINYMTWLPDKLHSNFRLIVTGIPCIAINTILKMKGATYISIPPLSNSESKDIASSICHKYHRTLNQDVLTMLLEKEKEKNVKAASNPLWLTMAVEELNLLDMDAFALAEKKYHGPADQRLYQLLMDTVRDIPPDVNTLYQWILLRAEKNFGGSFVENCLTLIAISRKGWRDSDLKHLVPILSGLTWEDISFSGLKRTLRAHLNISGNHNLLNFTHSQMRKAVINLYLQDPQKAINLHFHVNNHLMYLVYKNDPFALSERMHHLLGIGNKLEIAEFYGGLFNQSQDIYSDATLAEYIYSGSQEELDNRIQYLLDIMKQPSLLITKQTRIIGKYLNNLPDAMGFHLELKSKRKFFEAILRYLEEQVDKDYWKPYRALCHRKIGDVLFKTGDIFGSLKSYRLSQDLTESLVEVDPENSAYTFHHSKILLDIGIMLQEKDIQGSLDALKASQSFAESLLRKAPDNLDIQRHLAMIHINMGVSYKAYGDQKNAEKSYRTGIDIIHSYWQKNPDNFNIQDDLSKGHGYLGEILLEKGDLSGCIAEYQKSMSFAKLILRTYPSNLDLQRDLAVCHEKLGDALSMKGVTHEAVLEYHLSKEIFESIIKADPSNSQWKRDLAVSLIKIGEVLKSSGEYLKALNSLQSSLRIIETLLQLHPSNELWNHDSSVCHRIIGDTHCKLGNQDAAIESYQNCKRKLDELLQTDSKNFCWQSDLSKSHQNIGKVLESKGDFQGALKAYQSSLKIRNELVQTDSQNQNLQKDKAISYNKIGDVSLKMGETLIAQDAFFKKLKIIKSLSEANHENTDLKIDLAITNYSLGVALSMAFMTEAIDYFRNSLKILRELQLSGVELNDSILSLIQQLELKLNKS